MAVRGGQVLLFLAAALEPQSSKSCPALNDTASPLQPHTSGQRLLAASPHRWSPRNRVSLRHSRAPRSQAHDQLTALAGGLGKAAGGGGDLNRFGDWHRQRSPSDMCNHPCHWPEMLISSKMVAQIGPRDGAWRFTARGHHRRLQRGPLAGRLSCMLNEWLRWFECARLVGA
jgi:hypothetical protein